MIRLMRFRWLYFGLSLAVLIPGIISLVLYGLKPSIDFTGGALLEVESATSLERDVINQEISELYTVQSLQLSGVDRYILRGGTLSNEVKDEVVILMRNAYPDVILVRFETVGPTLGRELLVKMITAVILVSVFITGYIWWKFDELKYGVSAVLAMFHDSLILLGIFSLLGHFYGTEADVLFVTALLTTLSFSIHDTIVVYDRIREKLRRTSKYSFEEIVDAAVLETLSRSINNSVTIIVVLTSLVLLGGESIRWFSVALLIGAVTGTYSSTFTAAPLLLLWNDVAKWRKKKK